MLRVSEVWKNKLYSSFTQVSWVLCTRSWVEFEYHESLYSNSTHHKNSCTQLKYLISSHCNQGRSWNKRDSQEQNLVHIFQESIKCHLLQWVLKIDLPFAHQVMCLVVSPNLSSRWVVRTRRWILETHGERSRHDHCVISLSMEDRKTQTLYIVLKMPLCMMSCNCTAAQFECCDATPV
jgi:hypothetical protein